MALLAIAGVVLAASAPRPGGAVVPQPIPPVYRHLKDLHLVTPVVRGGAPGAAIVVPASGVYDTHAARIRDAVRAWTGASLPIQTDDGPAGAVPIGGHVIALGNRSTSALIGRLYDLHYCILDLKFPGPGGHDVRSLHNPFGNGQNVLLVGASDASGMEAAVDAFLDVLRRADARPGELSVGHVMEIAISPALRLEGPRHWDDGRQGAYGWNTLTDHMAMYYSTGRESHAREVVRYAFPDAGAREELRRTEFIDYRDSPLAESSDYSSHLMAVYWDLIEESPAFSDEERLKITNALARQLLRLARESVYPMTPASVVKGQDMHASYSALGLHTLGRYFQKDYPHPVWQHCLRAAERFYESLHDDATFAAGTDNLEWYSTEVQPILSYMILAGWDAPRTSGALSRLLRAQEALLSGRPDDPALEWASLAYFNKAAYLTGSSRWSSYRERIGLDPTNFRLGQSFWPDERAETASATDLLHRWTVYEMPDAHRLTRDTRVPAGEAFYFGSFRSAVGGTGDFILLDGYNGEARNPYHAFAIQQLRIDGQTVLHGYRNQVLVSAGGLVEPRLAMDGALRFAGSVGELAVAVGEVARPWVDWRRTLAQRIGRYAVIADEVVFRRASDHMAVETLWETAGPEPRRDEIDWARLDDAPRARSAPRATWNPESHHLTVPGADRSRPFEIHMADVLTHSDDPVHRLGWYGGAEAGDRYTQLSLIARASPDRPLACLRLAENAAALALPQPALAVVGTFRTTSGDLAVLAEDHVFGRRLTSAGLDRALLTATAPVDVSWNFATGELELVAGQATRVTLATGARPHSFRVQPGRHRREGVRLPEGAADELKRSLTALLQRAAAERDGRRLARESHASLSGHVPPLSSVFSTSVGAPVSDLHVAAAPTGARLVYAAAGPVVHALGADGTRLATHRADADVRAVYQYLIGNEGEAR